jgi:lipopolysaccharide transport system permease protein
MSIFSRMDRAVNPAASEAAPSATLDAVAVPAAVEVRVIEPRPGWRAIDFAELWRYRDLIYFLVWRDIKVRYAQSVLGVGWAVIQPLFMMVVFSVVFGRLAEVSSDGAPYAIFSYVALVPWTYFSNALTGGTASLTKNSEMLKKVYFPRLAMPLSAVLGKLVDFFIAFTLLGGLLVWYRITPSWWALSLPVLVLLMALTAAGMGMLLAALAVQYRDIDYGMAFGVQALMFATPVVYPASAVPDQFRLLYAINPMVGVIEGFRSAFLGTNPMPWDMLGIGAASAILVVIAGAVYFRRAERIFADVA